MNNLMEILDLLCVGAVHISITDFSGILGGGALDIGWKYIIHSKEFCDIAKKTAGGYELCMKCKKVCNYRAAHWKKPFSGICPFGLFEAVVPVVQGGKAICAVYVGGTVQDLDASQKRLQAALRTVEDIQRLSRLLSEYRSDMPTEKYFLIGEIVSDYIKKFCKESKKMPKQYHRAVALAMHCADVNYRQPLTVKAIAGSCYVSEKYLGRIFKEQTGCAFHKYLKNVRLEKAEQLLLNSDDTVLSIALDCGFNSSAYFNSEFVKKYGLTPKKYRKSKKML